MARTPPGYYLHLIAWAQIGVLARVYLAELFGSACPSLPWAPCLTSSGSRYGGAFFTDLPANILGSFLMGLFVSSDVLSNSLKHNLYVQAPMAMLPVKSPLQAHLAFQVGLRTGLCGSLTTFASWLTQMVLIIVGGHHTTVLPYTQWVEALGGLLLGTLAAMAALVVGQHCALLLYHKLNPGAFIPYGSPALEQRKLDESLHDNQQQQQQQRQVSGAGSLQGQLLWDGGSVGGRSSWGGSTASRGVRTISTTQQGHTTVVVVEADREETQQQQQWQLSGWGSAGSQGLPAFQSVTNPAGRRSTELAGMRQQQQQWQQQQQSAGSGDLEVQFGEGSVGGRISRDGSTASRGVRTVSTTQQGHTTVVVVKSQGDTQQQQQQQQERSSGEHEAAAAAAAAAGGSFSRPDSLQQQQLRESSSATSANGTAALTALPAAGDAAAVSFRSSVAGGIEGPVKEEEQEEEEEDEEGSASLGAAQLLVDGFAAVSIAVLTGISVWRIAQGRTGYLHGHNDPFSQEFFWWSILFGPLGCYVRYYLSRLNSALHGSWKWFPAGTFAANMVACIIDYVMKCIPVRHPLDSASAAVLAGVIGGVGGCLSTVSTWVVEIQRLMLSFPKTSHGYQYVFISLSSALLLGLLLYGVPVWTQ